MSVVLVTWDIGQGEEVFAIFETLGHAEGATFEYARQTDERFPEHAPHDFTWNYYIKELGRVPKCE